MDLLEAFSSFDVSVATVFAHSAKNEASAFRFDYSDFTFQWFYASEIYKFSSRNVFKDSKFPGYNFFMDVRYFNS